MTNTTVNKSVSKKILTVAAIVTAIIIIIIIIITIRWHLSMRPAIVTDITTVWSVHLYVCHCWTE